MTGSTPTTVAGSSPAAVPSPSLASAARQPSTLPHPTPRPSADDALTLAHDIRWLQDLLATLASWEDADDNVSLPEPLGGQQALHAVWRMHDVLVTGQTVQHEDLRLVERAVRMLMAAVANGDETLSEALLIHAPSGEATTRSVSHLLTSLDRLQPQGRQG